MDGINRGNYESVKRQEKTINFIIIVFMIISSVFTLSFSMMNAGKDANMGLNELQSGMKNVATYQSKSSSIVIESSTGTMIDGTNEHAKLPMASTTKIMTAYLAVESGKLHEYVTVPEYATKVEGSSIYLKAGEKLKLVDLVYGLMLRSGNDSAVTIAHHLAGSVENFAIMMNDKVKELGLENTNFMKTIILVLAI